MYDELWSSGRYYRYSGQILVNKGSKPGMPPFCDKAFHHRIIKFQGGSNDALKGQYKINLERA